jgi:hypothetical protein
MTRIDRTDTEIEERRWTSESVGKQPPATIERLDG